MPACASFQIAEGLNGHPNVEFLPLDQAKQADYIIELPINKGTCPGPYHNRTLVLDESDGPVDLAYGQRFWGEQLPATGWNWVKEPLFLAAFKRSFVWKDTSTYVQQHFRGMQYLGTPRPCYFPIQYPIRGHFVPEKYPRWEDRQYNLSNVLREEGWDADKQHEGARTATRVSQTAAAVLLLHTHMLVLLSWSAVVLTGNSSALRGSSSSSTSALQMLSCTRQRER
jgi:hypothetical protein